MRLLLKWEQLTENKEKCSRKVDYFAFGVMVYETLFGYRPYTNVIRIIPLAAKKYDEEYEAAKAVINKAVAAGSIPEDLADVMIKSLNPDPELLSSAHLKLEAETLEVINTYRPRVYVSPLRRCLGTAEQLKTMSDCGGPVVLKELQERNWGPLQGMTKEQIVTEYGQGPGELRNSMAGIETDEELQARVLEAWSKIMAEEASSEAVVVVTHQGCLRIIYRLLGIEFEKFKPGEARRLHG